MRKGDLGSRRVRPRRGEANEDGTVTTTNETTNGTARETDKQRPPHKFRIKQTKALKNEWKVDREGGGARDNRGRT